MNYLESRTVYTGSDSRIRKWQGGASDFSTGVSGSALRSTARAKSRNLRQSRRCQLRFLDHERYIESLNLQPEAFLF
jgi:hypothetical protein